MLLITLVVWCALWELAPVAALPHILFWILPILSTAVLEGTSRCADRAILTRTWTALDIVRLSLLEHRRPYDLDPDAGCGLSCDFFRG